MHMHTVYVLMTHDVTRYKHGLIQFCEPKMAAAPVEETVSHGGRSDPIIKTRTECKSVENVVRELRAVSTNSLRKLDEVNQYLEKLEKDDAMWNTETDDPIMTFDLENLRQAFRETIMLSGRYKAACKNLEHYLLKLEEHTRAAVQSGVNEEKLAGAITINDSEPLFDCVSRCITRCCTHVGNCGSKYKNLDSCLREIIDTYCTSKIKEQCGTQYLLSLLQSLSILNIQNDQNFPLYVQKAELENARRMVMAAMKDSEIAKTKWTQLDTNLTALKLHDPETGTKRQDAHVHVPMHITL